MNAPQATPDRSPAVRRDPEHYFGGNGGGICLLSAGYAPVHVVDLDAERASLNATLNEMVDRQHPYPAFVFNADWVMERINLGGQWLCTVLMPGMWETIPDPRVGLDMIAGLIHPDGLLSRMRDPARVGAAIVHQLRLEQLTNSRLEARVDALEQALHERYPEHRLGTDRDPAERSLHLDFDTSHGLLSFFTLQSVVGIPQHIAVGSPRVETWFPADVHTRNVVDRHVVPLERDAISRRPALPATSSETGCAHPPPMRPGSVRSKNAAERSWMAGLSPQMA